MPKSYKLKLLLLGSSGSGKTSFINGNNNDSSIGISFKLVECYANENDIYKFLIWDLKDHPRFHFMFKDFCRGAYAGLLCFDLSDKNSFIALNYWINLLREGSDNIPIILIGTKKDLENREVHDQEILDLIQEKNLDSIFFTSIYEENNAKQELFRYIVQKLDPNYLLSNFSIVPRELENEEFKNFLDVFSICPICKSELHYNSLKAIFFSKNDKSMKIKNQLLNLLEDINNYGVPQYNNVKFGIPCCKCYKEIFETE
ncbi:MAG: hypothetical protein ACTSV5_04620 [Promethearchaeota archaeon]